LLFPKRIPAFCPDFAQKWVMLIVVLLFVLFAVVFYGLPQGTQLLPSGAVLNLTGNGILPLSQFTITEELSAFISAMDKYHICPAFDSHNQVFGNFEELSDRPYRIPLANRGYYPLFN
jgi:hypothetical protein